MKINEIVIKGMKQSFREADMPEGTLTLRASYQVGRSVRGDDVKRLEDQDIIELVFEDGTTWHSSTVHLQKAPCRMSGTWSKPCRINVPCTWSPLPVADWLEKHCQGSASVTRT